jgi:hypothetical protein
MQPDEFKVTDRRGRAEEREQTRDPSAQPSSPRSGAPTAGSAHAAAPAPDPGIPQRSLAGLFMMLASSAVVAMGEVPDPLTGQTQRDLEQAARAIDLLVLLREKTEGNRSQEESRLLDDIVYDLQLRFVNAKKSGRGG